MTAAQSDAALPAAYLADIVLASAPQTRIDVWLEWRRKVRYTYETFGSPTDHMFVQEATIDRPCLSICIPTYNRARLLERQLAELDRPGLFDFDYEVVVADNCSTDDTQEVLRSATPSHYRLRTLTNRRNTGIIANLLNSLRQARGELVVYVADDDRLDPANLSLSVERMLAAPDLTAIYTGSVHRDLVTGEFHEIVGQLPEATYARERGGELVDTMQRAYLFPEFALYRVDALARTLFPGSTLFWPYPLIDRLLQLGPVGTTSHIFYQVVDRHEGETAARGAGGAGLEQRVWASIQDGMSLLAAKYQGSANPETDPQAAYLAYMGLQSFYASQHRHRYAEAFEIAMTLAAKGALAIDRTTPEWENFVTHVAVENFQRCFETMSGIAGIVCAGFSDEIFGELNAVFTATAAAETLPVTNSGLVVPSAKLADQAVLTSTEPQREFLIARGHPPGQILSLDDLRRVFSL